MAVAKTLLDSIEVGYEGNAAKMVKHRNNRVIRQLAKKIIYVPVCNVLISA